jgi:N-acetylglutamate synthase-like GNAT family acetyltransferase
MPTRRELFPWLASVYVAPAHRRQGIGSLLVRRVEQEALALGFGTLYLFTPDRETYYAHLGWTVLEHTEYMGEKVVIMTRNTGNSARLRPGRPRNSP